MTVHEMNQEKMEYLVRTFSRTNKKDYENYVLGAIWHGLNNLNLKPVTQQYVRRKDGKYAFIDLYFPQINLAVECDEQYHNTVENKEKDKKREADIALRLAAISEDRFQSLHVHFDENTDIETLNSRIDEVINAIKQRIKESYDLKGIPLVWEIVDPVSEAFAKGSVSVSDEFEYRTILDVSKLFGKNYKQYQRCSFSINQHCSVWCPVLAIEEDSSQMDNSNVEWLNTISNDRKDLYSKFIRPLSNRKRTGDLIYLGTENSAVPDKSRIVFAKCKDSFDRQYYKFLGVFSFKDKPDDKTLHFERVREEIKVSKTSEL